MSSGEDLRIDTKNKNTSLKEIELCVKKNANHFKIDSQHELGGDLCDDLMRKEIFTFDDEWNVHTTSENDETNG